MLLCSTRYWPSAEEILSVIQIRGFLNEHFGECAFRLSFLDRGEKPQEKEEREGESTRATKAKGGPDHGLRFGPAVAIPCDMHVHIRFR